MSDSNIQFGQWVCKKVRFCSNEPEFVPLRPSKRRKAARIQRNSRVTVKRWWCSGGGVGRSDLRTRRDNHNLCQGAVAKAIESAVARRASLTLGEDAVVMGRFPFGALQRCRSLYMTARTSIQGWRCEVIALSDVTVSVASNDNLRDTNQPGIPVVVSASRHSGVDRSQSDGLDQSSKRLQGPGMPLGVLRRGKST